MEHARTPGEILIVEDTPASLKLLADLLTGAGYAVRQAPDGELALWSARARPPELILLDVRMPGIDGFEVCRRLKEDPALREIPVIFLSAQTDTEDKIKGFRAGGIDYIGKPYQSEEVLARTRAHLALSRSQRALAATNVELSDTLAQLKAARGELRRTERLAALGSMVAGMAHELNTPIGNCMMSASTLEQRTREFGAAAESGLRRSDLSSYIDDALMASTIIMRNLRNSAELIARFKEVATDQASVTRRRFELDALLANVAASFTPRLRGTGVRLAIDQVPAVTMDSFPGALGEVLGHLLANALVHGFPDGAAGTITIEAREQGGALALAVCDDGAGIGEADLARVFEPFFTTRMGQGGGGLGLHIAHNLVTNVLGGTIDASSQPGHTRFELRCPAKAPALDTAQP
jgi:signal transduction histidine kinase